MAVTGRYNPDFDESDITTNTSDLVVLKSDVVAEKSDTVIFKSDIVALKSDLALLPDIDGGASEDQILTWNAVSSKWAADNIVTLVAGTANQVVVTDDTDNTITLSTPQNIHTAADPTFAGMNLTSSADFAANAITFQPAADSTTFFQILDQDGGTPVLNVDATNERVGIQTASPQALLDVGGYGTPEAIGTDPVIPALVAANNNGTVGMFFKNSNAGVGADSRFAMVNDAGNAYIAMITPSNANTGSYFGVTSSVVNTLVTNTLAGGTIRTLAIGTYNAGNLVLGTSNTARINVLSTGEVGVGKTPAASIALDVYGKGAFTNVDISNVLDVGAYGAQTNTGTSPSFLVKFGQDHAGATGLQLKNVSAGVSSDSRVCVIANDNNAYLGMVSPSTAFTTAFFGVQGKDAHFIWTDAVSGSGSRILAIGTYYANDIVFGTTNVERARILSTGEFGIGKTPAAGTKLDVSGSGAFGTTLDVGGFGTALSGLGTPTVTVKANVNGTGSMQMYNASSGTGADFRFVVSNNNKNQYLAVVTPGDGYSGTLFGINRNTGNFIFNNTLSGGTNRDLVLGTITANNLILGTSNAERFRISSTGAFTLTPAANTDIVVNYVGTTFSGVMYWMEDEDYFRFGDDVLMDSTERIYFRDTALSIHSNDDGYLDFTADTGVRINGSAGLSNTYTFGGGAPGEVATMTFTHGLLTGVTLVP